MRRLAAALAALAALAAASAASAYDPGDPLAARQWYLDRVQAFSAWPDAPALAPVRVAVLDTGIDRGHPELAGRIAAARSFVGGGVDDTVGHGTFVAGIIAAGTGDATGIAGLAPSAQLLVGKVVRDGLSMTDAEARAIRWAADSGARVINLSISGLRDPLEPERDEYSEEERSAIEYAYARGALVVAAVGNGGDAPRTPWPYASYPAALPHVLGVGALGRDGSVPAFSNRDPFYVDLVAPGEGIVSLFPRRLTAARPACALQGYSPCGSPDFRAGDGTSFAAPQVAAAAAVLFALRPDLRPEQVVALLERTAGDLAPATGCGACAPGRDAASGWGVLDVAAAVRALAAEPLPPRDLLEPNDDAGERAPRLWGARHTLRATIDFWDDQIDVYRVRLRAGQVLTARLRGPAQAGAHLLVWRPSTERVEDISLRGLSRRAAQVAAGGGQVVSHRATATGWYYVEVKATARGGGRYTLELARA